MTVSRLEVFEETSWWEMYLNSPLSGLGRRLAGPTPLFGDSMRARGSLTTPGYLTVKAVTIGRSLAQVALTPTSAPSSRVNRMPSASSMRASPVSLAVRGGGRWG